MLIFLRALMKKLVLSFLLGFSGGCEMPIYEYRCRRCGSVFEIIQKFSDAPVAFCSKCGGELNKLISQSTFHLKGSGWYATDYAHKSTNEAAPKKEKKEQPRSEPVSADAAKPAEVAKKEA